MLSLPCPCRKRGRFWRQGHHERASASPGSSFHHTSDARSRTIDRRRSWRESTCLENSRVLSARVPARKPDEAQYLTRAKTENLCWGRTYQEDAIFRKYDAEQPHDVFVIERVRNARFLHKVVLFSAHLLATDALNGD